MRSTVGSSLTASPEAVRNYLRLTIGGLGYEVFTVLLLDAQNRLIEACELFRGTLTQTSVYPREVVKMCRRAPKIDHLTEEMRVQN